MLAEVSHSPRPLPLGRQVQHQDPAGQVVHDDAALVPQVAPLLGGPRARRPLAARERPQHQRGERGALAERLGVAGDRRGKLRQLRRRRLELDALLDPFEHARRLPQLGRVAGVDQLGQRPVGGELGEPRLEPVPFAEERLFHRTGCGFASVGQPLPFRRAVPQRRAEPFEQLDEAVAGGFADGAVQVGEAHGEHADALWPVLAGDPDDRPALLVVGRLHRDGAGQVAAGPLERLAGGVEETPVVRSRVSLDISWRDLSLDGVPVGGRRRGDRCALGVSASSTSSFGIRRGLLSVSGSPPAGTGGCLSVHSTECDSGRAALSVATPVRNVRFRGVRLA